MDTPLDWNDLQYFLAVQACGSVAGAADALEVNHTTVLRRLGALEAALGARLFERFQSGYVITAAGEDLAERLAGLAEQIEAAARGVQGLDAEIRGTVRLTSTDTLFDALLLPLLQEFRTRHPRVQLQLVMNNAFMSLTPREADVAVRGTNRPPENLIGRRAGVIRTAPYASKAYLEGRKKKDWAAHDWVGADDSLAHLAQSQWLAQNVAPEKVVARIDSLVGMVDCVRNGMGAGMLLTPLADRHADLVRLDAPFPDLDTQIWVLTHPDLKRVARVRALAEFLYQKLSSDARLNA